MAKNGSFNSLSCCQFYLLVLILFPQPESLPLQGFGSFLC